MLRERVAEAARLDAARQRRSRLWSPLPPAVLPCPARPARPDRLLCFLARLARLARPAPCCFPWETNQRVLVSGFQMCGPHQMDHECTSLARACDEDSVL